MTAFVYAHQLLIVLAAMLLLGWGFAAHVIDTRLSGARAREITPVVPVQPPSPETAEFAAYLRGTRSPL